jgi:hypothetical protein
MKRYFALTALFLLVFVSCSNEDVVDPLENTGSTAFSLDPEYIAGEIIAQTGWPDVDGELRTPEGCGNIIDMEREELTPGIAHYTYKIKVGEGDYDVIGLHRVVKETRPYKPIKTCKNVFFQHGDAVGFEGMTLYGLNAPSAPEDRSMAIYMAQNDIDFWGIDQNWILVPQGVTDFDFMADWGILNQVENLDIALSIARFTRLMTGCGPGKMNLMGYSSGTWTGYAYLNFETQKKLQFRNVGGYIPVDTAFKTDFGPTIAATCGAAANYQAMYDAGLYADQVAFAPVGYLAITDPIGDSPLAPGYPNYTVAMLLGSATHVFFPFTPWYHYLAGEFSELGAPTGFQFQTEQAWLEFLLGACAYEPRLFELNYVQTACGSEDVPWDDHLGEITVPIFNVGSAGGLGNVSEYTLGLLGSSDVTSLVVSLRPAEYVALDFGHIDIFIADNAQSLVWMPILDWVNDHSCHQGKADQSWTKE